MISTSRVERSTGFARILAIVIPNRNESPSSTQFIRMMLSTRELIWKLPIMEAMIPVLTKSRSGIKEVTIGGWGTGGLNAKGSGAFVQIEGDCQVARTGLSDHSAELATRGELGLRRLLALQLFALRQHRLVQLRADRLRQFK